MVAFIGFAMMELVGVNFLSRNDGDFVANENSAIVSMPTNNVQSHVTIIR